MAFCACRVSLQRICRLISKKDIEGISVIVTNSGIFQSSGNQAVQVSWILNHKRV